MSDPAEIARHLHEQKAEVKKMAFALGLLVPRERLSELEAMSHCITEWMEDACQALEQIGQGAAKAGEA
jgi:hypothetical protein